MNGLIYLYMLYMAAFDNSSENLRYLFDNSNEYPVAPTGEVVPWPEAPTGVIMPNAPTHDIKLSALRNSKFKAYVAELVETVDYCHKHCNRTSQMTKHLNTINTLSGEIISLDTDILMLQKGGRRTRKRNTRNKRRRNTNRK